MPWMLPTLFRNLLRGPVTRRYPFVKREPFPATRGKLIFHSERCDFCGDCARVCPSGAIEVDTERKRLTYDPFKCIYCRTCVEFCLPGAITMDTHYHPPDYEKKVETHVPPRRS